MFQTSTHDFCRTHRAAWVSTKPTTSVFLVQFCWLFRSLGCDRRSSDLRWVRWAAISYWGRMIVVANQCQATFSRFCTVSPLQELRPNGDLVKLFCFGEFTASYLFNPDTRWKGDSVCCLVQNAAHKNKFDSTSRNFIRDLTCTAQWNDQKIQGLVFRSQLSKSLVQFWRLRTCYWLLRGWAKNLIEYWQNVTHFKLFCNLF